MSAEVVKGRKGVVAPHDALFSRSVLPLALSCCCTGLDTRTKARLRVSAHAPR